MEPENIKMSWRRSRCAWVGLALAVATIAWTWHSRALAAVLVRAEPARLQQDGPLVRYALARGNTKLGAPGLTGPAWIHHLDYANIRALAVWVSACARDR
jgi:hypothetical protein